MSETNITELKATQGAAGVEIPEIVIDDGSRRVPINNKFGEEIGVFYFRPTDIGMIDRYNKMAEKFPDVEMIFIESGGDNLSATFSPDLADATIYVIDVAQGEKIPRKGGPGVTRSDLLVINKTDLAPMVGASLEVMKSDSERMRKGKDFLFTSLVSENGADAVIAWIKKNVLMEDLV